MRSRAGGTVAQRWILFAQETRYQSLRYDALLLQSSANGHGCQVMVMLGLKVIRPLSPCQQGYPFCVPAFDDGTVMSGRNSTRADQVVKINLHLYRSGPRSPDVRSDYADVAALAFRGRRIFNFAISSPCTGDESGSSSEDPNA